MCVAPPDPLTLPSLADVRRHIPPHLFRADHRRALLTLIRVGTALTLSELVAVWLWVEELWLLYPIAWGFAGTTLFAVFEVMHACGHSAFVRSKRVNRWLGHVTALPLLYPFTAWQLWHDAHHRRPNVLGQTLGSQFDSQVDFTLDTAFTPAELGTVVPKHTLGGFIYRASRSAVPLVVYLLPLLLAFRVPRDWSERHRRRGRASLRFLLVGAPTLALAIWWASGSVWGVFHFWFGPLLFHAAWLGYYSFVQHTAPSLPNLAPDEWTPAHQLRTVLNTEVPAPIAWLHGGGVYHAIHHIAPRIAGYHLAAANRAVLASPYRAWIRSAPFSIRRFWRLQRQCQLWDPQSRTYRALSDRPPSDRTQSRSTEEEA